MAQSRIKRLQSAALFQLKLFKAEEQAICALCDRPIPTALRDAHHLIPKSRGGSLTVFMHRACHKQVHALFTETELARHYPSPQALREHPEVKRFINWVQDKPSHINPPTSRSRTKGQI
jgi:5-methylcytosine-specific restriction endonuclease McrA